MEFLLVENNGSDKRELTRSLFPDDLDEENVGDSLRSGPCPISRTGERTGERCCTLSTACLA